MGKPKQPAFDEAGQPVKPTHYRPALATGTSLELRAFLSETTDLDPSVAQLVWHEQNVILGNIPERTTTVLYRPSKVRCCTRWHSILFEGSAMSRGCGFRGIKAGSGQDPPVRAGCLICRT